MNVKRAMETNEIDESHIIQLSTNRSCAAGVCSSCTYHADADADADAGADAGKIYY